MKYKVLLVVFLLILFLESIQKNSCQLDNSVHKLIISISQPCSLSVAFLRMMRQREDFLIVHEPGIYPWFLNYSSFNVKDNFFHEPKTFPEVEALITSLLKQQNTFVKEESYAAVHYLYDSEIVKSDNTYVVFLLRHPHQMFLSIYNKMKGAIPKDFADYQTMWKLFNHMKSTNSRQPLIICTEDLVKDPNKIIRQFCNYSDIPFKEESLRWENLIDNFKDHWIWYDTPYARFDKRWHENALSSTGFMEINRAYAVDKHGYPTFEEIENIKIREFYLNLYQEMMIYYDLFLLEYTAQQKSYFEKVDKGNKR